jgi:hypothetical protein
MKTVEIGVIVVISNMLEKGYTVQEIAENCLEVLTLSPQTIIDECANEVHKRITWLAEFDPCCVITAYQEEQKMLTMLCLISNAVVARINK